MYSAKMGRNFVSLQNSFVRNNKVLFHAYSERTRTFPRISNSISTDFFFILYITLAFSPVTNFSACQGSKISPSWKYCK